MIFDGVEWDDDNLDHACRRLTAEEIEQVIANATSYRRHNRYAERILFGSRLVRPITAWEET